jgi:VWFA-related protein
VCRFDDRISRRGLLSGAPLWLAAARRLAAQEAPPPRSNTTFSADVKVVSLFATVRDKQGQIVRDLRQSDFLLDEDGRPQTIRYFTQESNLPLTLGLLVDTSGSVSRVLPEERRASYRFFEQVLREDKDLAFIIHFDREVELLQDLTNSRRKLESALGDLRASDGGGGQRQGYPRGGGPVPQQGGGRQPGTTLFDAVLLGSEDLMRKQSGRKAIILLSDGEDNGSKVSISRAIEAAQRADTMIYSIRFYDPSSGQMPMGGYGGRMGGRRGGGYPGRMPLPQASRPDGKKIMQRLSRETGGGYFEISRKLPLDKIYSRIEEELRHQYSIGYTPDEKAARGFRRIRLTTTQKTLVVQTRDGYYAD